MTWNEPNVQLYHPSDLPLSPAEREQREALVNQRALDYEGRGGTPLSGLEKQRESSNERHVTLKHERGILISAGLRSAGHESAQGPPLQCGFHTPPLYVSVDIAFPGTVCDIISSCNSSHVLLRFLLQGSRHTS